MSDRPAERHRAGCRGNRKRETERMESVRELREGDACLEHRLARTRIKRKDAIQRTRQEGLPAIV